MKLEQIFIGLAAMVVALIIVLGIAMDMYRPDHYNVSFSDDEATKVLTSIQNKTNLHYQRIQNGTEAMRLKTPGQNGSDYNPTLGQTEADLSISAMTALKETGTFLSTFTDLVRAIFDAVPLSTDIKFAIIWFVGLLIIIPVVFLLINSFLKNTV